MINIVEKTAKALDGCKKYLTPVLLSLTVSGVILNLSFRTENIIAQNLSLNLSASVLAIGIAIIIVDYTRDRWLEAQYKIPRAAAFNKIIGMHSVLALTLAVKNINNDRSILSDITTRIQLDQSSKGFLNSGSQAAINKLSKMKPSDILIGFSREEITGTLKTSIEALSKNYSDISNLYVFSFNDVSMRSAYVELLESLNSLLGSFVILGLGDKVLDGLFMPVDPKKHGAEKMTADLLVATMLIAYLKEYLNFTNTYAETDKNLI